MIRTVIKIITFFTKNLRNGEKQLRSASNRLNGDVGVGGVRLGGEEEEVGVDEEKEVGEEDEDEEVEEEDKV